MCFNIFDLFKQPKVYIPPTPVAPPIPQAPSVAAAIEQPTVTGGTPTSLLRLGKRRFKAPQTSNNAPGLSIPGKPVGSTNAIGGI